MVLLSELPRKVWFSSALFSCCWENCGFRFLSSVISVVSNLLFQNHFGVNKLQKRRARPIRSEISRVALSFKAEMASNKPTISHNCWYTFTCNCCLMNASLRQHWVSVQAENPFLRFFPCFYFRKRKIRTHFCISSLVLFSVLWFQYRIFLAMEPKGNQ